MTTPTPLVALVVTTLSSHAFRKGGTVYFNGAGSELIQAVGHHLKGQLFVDRRDRDVSTI